MLISGTPWQMHPVDGVPVWVKREDRCCSGSGGPRFSKMRGVTDKLLELKQWGLTSRVGVVDSGHSKAGWGVSWAARQLGLPVSLYYPVMVREGTLESHTLRPYQRIAQKYGAELNPIQATMSAVVFNRALADFRRRYPDGYMFPNGLKLPESIQSTAQELSNYTPAELLRDDYLWVVSASSATLAQGVALGLARARFRGRLVVHLGYSRPEGELRRKMSLNVPEGLDIQVVDEGYQYADRARDVRFKPPFPCNPYYDLKAWAWLTRNIRQLPYNGAIFWNIGA